MTKFEWTGCAALGRPAPAAWWRRYRTIEPAGQAYGFVLRSPYANAKILSIDTSAAENAAGVLGVWTGDDYAASGLGNIPCAVPRQKPDGSPMFLPPNSALRAGAVKMVGDPVCWVVAETSKQAQDAAELIIVDDEQKAITSTAHALDTDAGTVWDEAPDNVCFVFEQGTRTDRSGLRRRAPRYQLASLSAAFRRADGTARLYRRVR